MLNILYESVVSITLKDPVLPGESADYLIDLSGLENLNVLNGGIWIFWNGNLESLDGINNLDTINFD